MDLPRREFEDLAERAFAAVPKEFREKLLNVEISVQDLPGPEADEDEGSEDLMGLYVGPMRSEIQEGMLSGAPPDELMARVLLYKRNIESACSTRAELAREVALTLRHELAHHFGFEDEELERIWPEGA
ncbi:MAG: metallopeptidase family protein [Elusimicrobia bacterium]|nr:metallopeptidase family protein [Elusimicrobiota bacterium]